MLTQSLHRLRKMPFATQSNFWPAALLAWPLALAGPARAPSSAYPTQQGEQDPAAYLVYWVATTGHPTLEGGAMKAAITISLHSPAFEDGQPIPQRYTEDGENLSPPLNWGDVPPGTVELALIVDDPDAPSAQPWVHWVIYHIPPTARGLPEGIPRKAEVADPKGALQGKNSFMTGSMGYRGPAPPKGHGIHHYHFCIYALDQATDLKAGADKQTLLDAMEGHVIGQGELVGTYVRP